MKQKNTRKFVALLATLTALATMLATITQARTVIPQITLVYGVDTNLTPWICVGSFTNSLMTSPDPILLTQPQQAVIESSPDMVNWKQIYANEIGANTTNTIDDLTLPGTAFYRLKISPIVSSAPVATLVTPWNAFAPDERAIGDTECIAGVVYLTWTNTLPAFWKAEQKWQDSPDWEDENPEGILEEYYPGDSLWYCHDTLGVPSSDPTNRLIMPHYERFTGLDSSGNPITGVSNPVDLWDIGVTNGFVSQ